MKTNQKPVLNLLLTILLALALPILGVALGFQFSVAWNTGSLARWERLPEPPARVEKFVGGSTSQVFIQAADGQIYACTLAGGECWAPADAPPDYPSIDAACAEYPIRYDLSAPPGKVMDVLETQWCHFEAGEQTNYALLEDGSLWRWHHRDANFLNLARAGVSALGGCVAGLLFGAIILFSFWLFNRALLARQANL